MQQQRQKIPKDGPGPRGVPDCYYTSRVLNSTARYEKFVRKLRADEEEQRKGAENKVKALKDVQNSDFFIRCDRRSLINNVARRVDLCLQSYQDDLDVKKKRLKDLLQVEEEENIRKLVAQAQSGNELIWQDKQERLKYLLAKRKKEHEEKFRDTPLSKCAHVLSCITKLRAKEAEEIQLYQMKEKQHRRMAEKEFDNMWYEVAMKEADALATRMEMDAIERKRRDTELVNYTDQQLEQRRLKKIEDQRLLKEESIRFKAIWDADIKKEEEAERKRDAIRKENAQERKDMIEETRRTLARRKADIQLVDRTWDSLAATSLSQQNAEIELRRKKEREIDMCNRKLIELKEGLNANDAADNLLLQDEAKRRQDDIDKRRCDYLSWSQKTNRDVRKAMIDQIKDRQEARDKLKEKLKEQDEYHRQLYDQTEQLLDHKALTDAQARKQHQRNLLDQIEYNKLLKERARQEELEQIKKCQQATQDYQQDINKMLCRWRRNAPAPSRINVIEALFPCC